MGVPKELNRIRSESRGDFRFNMIALDNVTTALEAVQKEMAQIRGRMARQEERFELMLDIVQRQLDDSVKRRASKTASPVPSSFRTVHNSSRTSRCISSNC